jgi:glycosyltransferase involved in cell wall biosynthesis
MRKLKLAIFTGSDIRSFGGVEKYVIELCKRLKKFSILVFSYRGNKNIRLPEKEIKKLLRAKLKFFKALTVPISKERIPLSISGFRTISSLSSFDTVYLTDSSVPMIFIILLYLRIRHAKTKVILGVHDPGFLRSKPQVLNPIRNLLLKIYRPLQKIVLFSIPNMHVINTYDLRLLKDEGYRGKVYYIPNFLYYNKNQINIKENNDKFIVSFGGRLAVYHKGIDLLVKIVDKVLSINKNIVFHIFGSGEDGQMLIEELSKKYPKNVEYLGFIFNDRVENEYLNASLYILTSRIESFSLVTLEAQAHGLPVVSFDIKGPHDIIKNDFQGKLIEPFKIEDFVEAILYYYKLWEAGELSENYKRRIVNYIFSKYSDKKIIPKLEKMFENRR